MGKGGTKIIRVDEAPTTLFLPKSKLVVIDGPDKGQEKTVDKGVLSIGTHPNNDLQISDETVSRFHAEIRKTKDGYLVIDKGSTNGTFLEGLRIKEAFLQKGSIIRVGKTRIKFTPLDEKVEILPSDKEKFGDLVGKSLAMRKIYGVLEKVAPTNVTVVITGETGTGKEVVARAIHEHSKRKTRPFIVFDCGAVAETLIESELFGHEKGSFTGATSTRQGAFELADGGTIFLDEIGELSMDLQPKLLRALESGEVKRVGADRPKKVNVRVICATNRNLKEEVKNGKFREDLYFRISVVQIYVPPLRKRKEDIPLLVNHFIKQINKREGKSIRGISDGALNLLKDYEWPGNVRELKNAIDRAVSLCEGNTIEVKDLPEYIKDGSLHLSRVSIAEHLPFKDAKERWIESFEKDYLIDLLRRNDLNISKAAKEAKIDRKSVQRLLKKYGINVKDL